MTLATALTANIDLCNAAWTAPSSDVAVSLQTRRHIGKKDRTWINALVHPAVHADPDYFDAEFIGSDIDEKQLKSDIQPNEQKEGVFDFFHAAQAGLQEPAFQTAEESEKLAGWEWFHNYYLRHKKDLLFRIRFGTPCQKAEFRWVDKVIILE